MEWIIEHFLFMKAHLWKTIRKISITHRSKLADQNRNYWKAYIFPKHTHTHADSHRHRQCHCNEARSLNRKSHFQISFRIMIRWRRLFYVNYSKYHERQSMEFLFHEQRMSARPYSGNIILKFKRNGWAERSERSKEQTIKHVYQ